MKKILQALFLFFYTLILHAEADGPDYWRVHGVAEDDVLNMRRLADPAASKVGEIPADAQCIKNMGCKGGLSYEEFTTLSEVQKQQLLKQRPRWCLVNYRGKIAWVAGAYLREGHCDLKNNSWSNSIVPGSAVVDYDPFNYSYSIENEAVVLRNGKARETIPGSSAIIITEMISAPLYANLDDTNSNEAVSVLLQQTGGSGTFYYLAVAANGEKLIESYFLGDRIKIESLKAEKKVITVDYLEREKGQAMASMPTVRVSREFKLVGEKIVGSNQ